MQRFSAVFLLSVGLGTWLVPQLQAGKTLTWRHAEAQDWQSATQENLSIDPSGEVTLAPQLEKLADVEAGSIFDLAVLPQGKILAATAEPSQVVLLADGKTKTLWKSESEQVLSLLAFDQNSFLLGTAPSGKILQLGLDGKSREFAKVQGDYIWQMVKDSQGNVFAGTGPEGRIEKIAANGKVQTFYRTNQTHVLSLAIDRQDRLFAGTDGTGLVFAIQPSGQTRVLYDASEQEIRTLFFDGRTLYAGTAAGVVGERSSSRTNSNGNYRGGPNRAYAIQSNGQVQSVFTTEGQVFTLGSFGTNQQGEPLLIGTGEPGTVHRLDTDKQRVTTIAKIDASQVLSLANRKEGQVLFATGNPARVYSLSSDYHAGGSLLSTTMDAKLAARFGAMNWYAETPAGTSLSIATRSGNTETPDETWSDWSAEQTDPTSAKVLSPPGRFLQYRVTFKTSNPQATPLLRSLVVRYRTANQAPAISSLTVPHVTDGAGKERQEKLEFTWAVKDANEDELKSQLDFRKLGWKQWIPLKEVTEAKYEWDVTSVPQGVYQLRLTVSDRPSNPASEALDTIRESEPFVIDNRPPQVTAEVTGKQAKLLKVKAVAKDTLSPIVKASYSLDGGEWQEIFPVDRLFDTKQEEFTPTLGALTPGTHVMVLKATDAAGFTGSADLVIEVPGK